MKLRNKKTGVIIDFEESNSYFLYDCGDKIILGKNSEEPVYGYTTLKEFIENWEDYNPKEPLIKDEKIRKAVRTWAEANGLDAVKVYDGVGYIGFENGNGHNITFKYQPEFGTEAPTFKKEHKYTIEELCGEEE